MKLTSINIGQERSQQNGNRIEITGIYKLPIQGPAQVMTLGIKGDFIASEKDHGGPEQAVYVHGGEGYSIGSHQLGEANCPGNFCDNTTASEMQNPQFHI